jgi:TolB protein
VSSLAWSADGRRIAAVCDAPGHVDQIVTTNADNGAPPPSTLRLPASVAGGDTGLRLAGWWPDGLGLLLWVDPQHSASLAADGMSLVSVGLDAGAPVHPLATTLGYPSWLSWSPDGHHLVAVEGSDRRTWTGKRLTVCDAHNGECHPLTTPGGTVAIDPTWSPDGSLLAFVRAADAPDAGGETAAWTDSRQLWTSKPDGSDATRVAIDLTGVNGPRWSADGTRLYVVAGDRAVVVDVTDGATTPLGSPLSAGGFAFYGTTDWSALLAWH